jgi:hypothetical protein
MAAINDEEVGKKLFQFFCRHLVALGASYWMGPRAPDQPPHFTLYSGTLIKIRDVIFFLTAGHALKELREAMLRPEFNKDAICLIDSFGLDPTDKHPIPIALKPEDMVFIDDDELGLDFGLIPLRPYYLNLLAANGVIAIEEERWAHQHRVRFDAHFILGCPAEHTEPTLSERGYAYVKPMMIQVHPLPSDAVVAHETVYERFCGHIARDINSPVGMSGGPILGFNFDEPVRYWVVGIQSAWLENSRMVFGCPVPTLATLVTSILDKGPKASEKGSDE